MRSNHVAMFTRCAISSTHSLGSASESNAIGRRSHQSYGWPTIRLSMAPAMPSSLSAKGTSWCTAQARPYSERSASASALQNWSRMAPPLTWISLLWIPSSSFSEKEESAFSTAAFARACSLPMAARLP
jgi:hypothetical protein